MTDLRPHNVKAPLNLRKYPVCYLCGCPWELVRTQWTWKQKQVRDGVKWWKLIIQCTNCVLLTWAEADEAVLHSRNWGKHHGRMHK